MANEKRLIDAKAVLDALYDADAITMKGVKIINQFPTVDAVEVVRCKVCKHWVKSSPFGKRVCWFSKLITTENEFCSSGGRRTDNG